MVTPAETKTEPDEGDDIYAAFARQGVFADWSARDWATGALDMTILISWWSAGIKRPLEKLAFEIGYRHAHPRGYRDRQWRVTRRQIVDVDSLVDKWLEVLVGLSTAHSHAGRTAADEQTDELLGPLLTAPVAQIRAFAAGLAKRLREDERVPFMVWSSFQRILDPLIQRAPDGEIIELKKHLAAEIAEKVEKGLSRADLVDAIAGALQWRSESALTKVNQKLDQGEKPRIKGRESCLFLEVAGETVLL